LDCVALDEEPPADIYSEALARISATKGMCWLTFTPLLGATEVVRKFYDEESEDRALTVMTIDDVDHFSEEDRKQLIAGYRPHEREARTKGIPSMGAGAVYPVSQEGIEVDAFETPDFWPTIIGMDFGWQHPTVAAKLVYDRDDDAVYLTDIYKQAEATVGTNAAAIRAKYGQAPVAWPHDGMQHDRSSGTPYAQLYREAGINMLKDPAKYADSAGNSVEAGIADILDRMQSGRFYVFKHLEEFWTEMRQYHRDEKTGKVVKAYDDVLDAVRYGVMSLRHARTVQNGKRRKLRPRMAKHVDYDVFDTSDFSFG
jgi:phage terminase large subunit-like protein